MILTAAKSNEVADRIRDAVDGALVERNVSARRASIDVVGHDGLIRDIRAGRIPSADRVEALFNYLGLEAYFGPKRFSVAPVSVASNHQPGDDALSGFLTVPWVEGALGAGSAPVSFSRVWLDSHDLKIDFLKAATPDQIELDGIPSEDTIAVLDTRPGLRKGHGLWCYRRAGLVSVSHVTFADAITIIHPAHQDQTPEILKDAAALNLNILGKVVWLGQSLPVKGKIR